MKQTRIFIFFIMLITTLLASCTTPSYHPYDINTDLSSENWMPKMKVNPRLWAMNTDPWFLTGHPVKLTHYAAKTPVYSAMSDTTVRVPNFTNVVINGDFRVQIVGSDEHNTVSILGPNAIARQVAVNVNNNTISINQLPQAKDVHLPFNKVIVRISVKNLRKLMVNGNGLLVGRGITSDHLDIVARGCEKILLSGCMNVTTIFAGDKAIISILGAQTPCLKVKSVGGGIINLAGRIGIQSIINLGVGSVTIVGADSDRLAISAAGASMTRVIGSVNLKSVLARQKAQVYVLFALSKAIHVRILDNAYVGIAGRTGVLSADLTQCGFLAAKSLCATVGYVQACNYSHANVRIQQRLFAKALNQSSIYFIGPPSAASRFTSGYSVILPLSTDDHAMPAYPYHEATSWKFTGARSDGAFVYN